MLKNIKVGLEAIAKKAEDTGKVMEGAGKKAGTYFPTILKDLDRLMPGADLSLYP